MSNVGTTILTPFRRDRKRDFASGSGAELLRSKVLQVLLTQGATPQSSGELPWRTAFGSGLELLRHRSNDAVLAELARVTLRDALRRWLPEAELVSVRVGHSDSVLELRVGIRGAVTSGASGKVEEALVQIAL